MRVPCLTIDANCVINLLGTSSTSATSVEELRTLMRYAMANKVEIAVTTRLEADLVHDRDEVRRRTLLDALQMFPVISTVGRWDVSKWDSDVWPDASVLRLFEEIQQILSPGLNTDNPRYRNRINDIDHLVGHVLDGRDIFVTDDKGILRHRDQLQRGPGIVVMTPTQCIDHVDGIVLRSTPRTLPMDGIVSGYHDRRLQGTVTFDYSNNNHGYALGEGQHLFETKWSKSSDTSIHAYTDGPSIQALALAKGATEIRDIIDAELHDFSSRVRTPRLSQIIVWRNVNRLYGATKIVAIKDDSRGDEKDELTFEFVLLPMGKNFSAA